MKKVKIFTLVVICSILLGGVFSCRLLDNVDACYVNVQKEYPTSIVWRIPNDSYGFIVADTCGAVYYVRTLGTNHSISHRIFVKPCDPKK